MTQKILRGVLVADVANRCKLSECMFLGLMDQGFFPKPNMQIRNRQGYTDKQAARCVAKSNKIGGLFRISHLSRLGKCHTSQIRRWIEQEKITSPQIQVYASEFYTGNEVNKILKQVPKLLKEDAIASNKKSITAGVKRANKRYEARRKRGFFSSFDVARMSGVSPTSVTLYQNHGNIQRPKLEVKGYFGYYYTRKQASKIVKFFEKRKKK